MLPITYVIKTVHADPWHYQKVVTIARRTCPPAGGGQEVEEERENSRENALNAWHILLLALSILARYCRQCHKYYTRNTLTYTHAGSGSSIQKEWAYMTYG